MQKFLDDYVNYYINNIDRANQDKLLILPSKRSVAALKNTFTKSSDCIFLPEIIDIVSFIERLSNLDILNHQESVLEFYNIYKSLNNKNDIDKFESFYAWASILINDFNELDRYLVETDKFFEHHKALKTLNYFGEEKTKLIKSYIAFWEKLPEYYDNFKSYLLESNKAYQGLAYRQASLNLDDYLNQNSKTINFIGFNALNKAEENIFECCLEKNKAKIAWDIDQSFLEEKHHPSNKFINKYQKKWTRFEHAFINLKTKEFSKPKSLSVLSSPKNIGQAKSVSNILKHLSDSEIQNTAIVLNDEKLLNPILNSIPKSIKDVNITMGLPLKQTPVSDFFNLIIEHQKNKTDRINSRTLSQVLSHKLISQNSINKINNILLNLKNQNILSVSYEYLLNLEIFDSKAYNFLECLKLFEKPKDFIDSILNTIEYFLKSNDQIYRSYLLAYQKLFTDLKADFLKYQDLNMMSLKILFEERESSETLNFKGSKNKGLQIMGMLESRLLDFENIILTSVNEGILPAGKTENSYITYNLKKQYELPTHIEKDAIYAYHFFRIIQRSKKCFIIYDNDQTGFNKGEKSRFINYLQIFKSPKHVLEEKQFSLSTKLEQRRPVEIKKTPEIIIRLKEICNSGLSPTALTTYILNPILFYKRYVLEIKELDEIDEVINPRDFGTVIHQSIESFYKNSNPTLSEEILKGFSKQVNDVLTTKFQAIYAKNAHESGLNRIQFETAKAYLKRFISKEKQSLKKGSVKILEIEKSIRTEFHTKNHSVILKGQIDRVDIYGEKTRIIDLKTGNVTPTDLKFDAFDKLILDYDYAKAFQILFYAYMYSKDKNISDLKAGIISFKNLNPWFMPLKFQKSDIIDKNILNNFEEVLGELIDEILNPDIAFVEKETIFKS